METDKAIKSYQKEKKLKNKNKNDFDEKMPEKNRIATSKERKRKQKEKLNEIDNYLDDLMGMANTMGQELNTQNNMIQEVQHKMEDLDTRFQQKNRKLNAILKK